jgi:hypothetical protein
MHDENPLKPADIAKMFNQSISWVSKNSKKLGGMNNPAASGRGIKIVLRPKGRGIKP